MYKLGGYKINSDNFWSSRVRGGGFSKLSYYPKSIKNEGCFSVENIIFGYLNDAQLQVSKWRQTTQLPKIIDAIYGVSC